MDDVWGLAYQILRGKGIAAYTAARMLENAIDNGSDEYDGVKVTFANEQFTVATLRGSNA